MHEGTRKRTYNVVLELLTVDRDRGSGEDVEETELIITLLDALGIALSFNGVDHNADVSGINVLVVDLGAVELSSLDGSGLALIIVVGSAVDGAGSSGVDVEEHGLGSATSGT